jgi:uncharacterized protein (TIGR00369 family)
MSAFTPANPHFAALVRQSVLSMPFAKLLGFDYTRIEPGDTEIVLPYREELSFRPGFFAGAVVGSLADFAAVSATFTLVPAGWLVATVDYDVKVVAPPAGEKLIARGRVIKPGSTLLFGEAQVFVEKGGRETLCAVCLATARAMEMR